MILNIDLSLMISTTKSNKEHDNIRVNHAKEYVTTIIMNYILRLRLFISVENFKWTQIKC